MKLVNRLTTIFWDWVLVWLKRKNKNLVVTKKLSAYVDQLSAGNSEEQIVDYKNILKLPNGSYQTPISQIRNLQLLAKAIKAKRILEVGTFRGFTTMSLALVVGTDGKLVTCEKNTDNIAAARELWKKYKVNKKISVASGDAGASMEKLLKAGRKFDFIYIDADKSQYEHYLDLAMELCIKGGLVVIDNALWAGLVAYPETKYSHAKAIDKLNRKIFASKSETCSIIPAWDGVVIILKN